ncbi:MAG: AraC family transcriptional regulator [Opitutaceae bacterium]|nr:AraC family transcriptional regulator [Opitutaceae bacterium]
MRPALPHPLAKLADAHAAESLFDLVPDVVFFVKDAGGRYVVVNLTLVTRCGRQTKAELVGRTVADFFPADLAAAYAAQDREVLTTGRPLLEKLELHLYPDRRPGWCLTSKIPLRGADGRVAGLAGLSRDLAAPGAAGLIPPEVAGAIAFLQENFAEPLSPARLAARAGLPPERFARVVKRIFHLTPGQLIIQTRLQEATRRLRETDERVAAIAAACGFYDHSSFTRHFKAATGVTPVVYRAGLG